MPFPRRDAAAIARARHAAAKYRREAARRAAQRTEPEPLPHLGGMDCWCGQAAGHDWPGKTDGAPHPRDP